MPFPSLRAHFSPRPIASYALLLLFTLVAALGILAAFVLHDAARLREEVAQSDE